MLAHINTVLHGKTEAEVREAIHALDELRAVAIGTNSTVTILTMQRVWQWEMTLQKAFMNHLDTPGVLERLEIISVHHPHSMVAAELSRVYIAAVKSWREFQRDLEPPTSSCNCVVM